jgi:hypothetical protein
MTATLFESNILTYSLNEVPDGLLRFQWLHLLEISQQVVQGHFLSHSQFLLLMSSNILKLFQLQHWHGINGYQMKLVSSFPIKVRTQYQI